MLDVNQIPITQYQDFSQTLEMTDFKGQDGLSKALKLSDNICDLRNKIFIDQGYIKHQIEDLNSLHKRLVEKVVTAQKGSLVFPLSLHQTIQKEHNELKNEYENICEQLDDVKKKILLQSFETDRLKNEMLFDNGARMVMLLKSKYLFELADKLPDPNLIKAQKKEKFEQLIRGSEKIKQCERFLEPLLHGICDRVETEQESQGFFFRVTNKKGIHNYLVGTLHNATDNMTQTPGLNYVIDRSDRLILEVSSPIINAHYRLRKLNFMNPYRNCIDLTLYDAAWNKGLPIESLETKKDQLDALFGETANASYSEIGSAILSEVKSRTMSLINDYMKAMTTGTTQDKLKTYLGYIAAPSVWVINTELQLTRKFCEWSGILEPIKQPIEDRAQEALLHALWQEGDASLFPTFSRQFPDAVTSKRNYNWLISTPEKQGMIDRLMSTEESLCYAFGAAHLVAGNPNILGALNKKEDFTLEHGHYDYETSEMKWKLI